MLHTRLAVLECVYPSGGPPGTQLTLLGDYHSQLVPRSTPHTPHLARSARARLPFGRPARNAANAAG
eukprot:205024-Chlamydomonas_euryale.AAC.2